MIPIIEDFEDIAKHLNRLEAEKRERLAAMPVDTPVDKEWNSVINYDPIQGNWVYNPRSS